MQHYCKYITNSKNLHIKIVEKLYVKNEAICIILAVLTRYMVSSYILSTLTTE